MLLSKLMCILFILLLPAQLGAEAANQQQQQAPQMRHGTVLLSSVTLLDDTPVTAHSTKHRCCLTLKAYTSPVHEHSTTAQPAMRSNTAASATFSTCSSDAEATTAAAPPPPGCRAALMPSGSPHASPGPYKVALLLTTQQTQPDSRRGTLAPAYEAAAAPAPADNNGTTPALANTTNTNSTPNTTDSVASETGSSHASTAAQQDSGVRAAPTAATALPRQAILQDVLVTLHAEQEVSGHVYLAIVTQVVRAGTAVVRIDINMSQYSHTWTREPAALPQGMQDGPPGTAAAAADPGSNDPPAATPAETAEAEQTFQSSQGPDNTTASTDTRAQCSNLPAQGHTAEPTKAAMQAADAPAPPSAPLSELLPPSLASDPAALTTFLTVLGYRHAAGGAQLQQQPTAAAAQQAACVVSNSHSSSSMLMLCTCPAFKGTSLSEAATEWIADLQVALSSCPHDPSLSSYLLQATAKGAAAATTAPAHHAGRTPQQEHHQQQPAAIAVVLNQLAAACGLPSVPSSSVTPQQQALLIATVAFLLLVVALKVFSSPGSSQPGQRRNSQPRPATAEKQPQQQKQQQHSAQMMRPTANTAEQDAEPLQVYDQHTSLDDMLQGIDADPFGYGAAPVTTAVTAAGSGSLLAAAAKSVRRVSAMAAGEAAGALKDAFMRRNSSGTSHQHTSAAGGVGAAAAGTAATDRMGPAAPAAAAAGVHMVPAPAAAAAGDWLDEDDEDRVNQLPDSVQRQLQAEGRWTRDSEGRLVRSSWKAAVRNSLAAAAQAVAAAVSAGSGGGAAPAPDAVDVEEAEAKAAEEDAADLQQLLAAAPGAIVTFGAH